MVVMDTDGATALPAEDDPEAHYQRALRTLENDGIDGWESARAQFERAAALGGPDMAWRIAAATQWIPTQAGHWMSQAVLTTGEPGGITVDPGLLRISGGDDGDPLVQHWEIAVRSAQHDTALTALTAARHRLWAVLEDGTELPPDEAEDLIDDTDLYSPNYVATKPDVPSVWLDCKGAVLPLMARTVLRIVTEELKNAGIHQAVLFTPRPDDAHSS
nr:hypothetical protein KPHV_87550 [Kitasatospora purpeofusca]